MSKRDVLEVAIKIMGLYSLLAFFGSIPAMGGAIATADNSLIQNKSVYVWFTCIGASLYFVFAVAFLWRARRIAEMLTRDSEIGRAGERTELPSYSRLDFWVKILGLYFLVGVSSRLFSDVAHAGYTVLSGFWWSKVLGEAFEVCLAVILVFKSKQVSHFIERHAEPSTGGNAAPPRASV